MGSILIRCTVCDKWFSSYKAYSRHLFTKHPKTEEVMAAALTDHDETVKFYSRNPHVIERGMRIIGKEVWILRGRIDLVYRDKHGNLCLVDVTKGKDLKRKKQQLVKYRRYVRRLGRVLYDVKMKKPIRLFIIQPGKEPLEVD